MVAAVQTAIDNGGLVGDVIPTAKVMEVYNDKLPDKAQLTEGQVGSRLYNLGFSAKRARYEGGGAQFRGRLVDDEQLTALRQKCGLVDDDEKTAGHDPSHSSQPSQPDTTQACDDLVTTVTSETENLRRPGQPVPPPVTSYATPSESSEATVTGDVQALETHNATNSCNCLEPEHYAEDETHPPSCPVCGSILWCKACRGCIACRLP